MITPLIFRRFQAAALGSVALLAFSAVHAAEAIAPVPAPVPPAVAIARPTPEELKVVGESLKKFLTQGDSAIKAIAARYPDLIGVRPPRPVNPAVVPALLPGFQRKHTAYVELAQKGDIDVLFMGDSITDFWRTAGSEGTFNPRRAGKAIWDRYYSEMKIANFGISGDFTQGVLYRLQNGEGQGFQPKVIQLLIGTNNAATCSSAEIAEGIGAIVLELHKDFPAAKILLLAIFPRGAPDSALRKTVMDVNPLIAKLHDGKAVFYLDIGAKFLDADGNIPSDIMDDALHPTEKGYVIWAEAVKQPLADLMK